jgi:prenyltransferase beta subunit
MEHTNLRKQAKTIVEDKIKRICAKEFLAANQKPDGSFKKKHVPYSVPSIVSTLTGFLSELADEQTTVERIEGIASFVTSGEIFEKAF